MVIHSNYPFNIHAKSSLLSHSSLPDTKLGVTNGVTRSEAGITCHPIYKATGDKGDECDKLSGDREDGEWMPNCEAKRIASSSSQTTI